MTRSRALACLLLMAAVVGSARQVSAAIDLSGGLAANSAWVGDDLSFWMRIRNDEPSALRLRIQVVGSGLNLTALCTPMSGTDGPPCSSEATVTLAARSERFVTGVLRVEVSGQHRVTLQGVDAAGHVFAIPLGSLSITSRAWSVVEWVKNLLISLTLPIVLAVLGRVYQRRMQQEQDERKTREQEMANARAQTEKALAERATSVRLMLPIVHQYAIRYYVDLAGAYWRFARDAKSYAHGMSDLASNTLEPGKVKAAKAVLEAKLDEAVLAFIKMHLIHREFYQQVGGMYLATLIAEDILHVTFARLHESLLPSGDSTAAQITRILDALQESRSGATTAESAPSDQAASGPSRMRVLNRTKFSQFMTSAGEEANKAHDAVKARLKTWLEGDGHAEGLNCAQLYGDVLNHEMNIALQQWYGDVPKLDVMKYGNLCGLICDDLDETLKERALAYLGIAGSQPPGKAC